MPVARERVPEGASMGAWTSDQYERRRVDAVIRVFKASHLHEVEDPGAQEGADEARAEAQLRQDFRNDLQDSHRHHKPRGGSLPKPYRTPPRTTMT
jgi:hypothetical protein